MLKKVSFVSLVTLGILIGSTVAYGANNYQTCDESAEFTYNGVTYKCVKSRTTGRVWLDRNIGALKKSGSIDEVESFGDYFQWGRPADGHELVLTDVEVQSTDKPARFIDFTPVFFENIKDLLGERRLTDEQCVELRLTQEEREDLGFTALVRLTQSQINDLNLTKEELGISADKNLTRINFCRLRLDQQIDKQNITRTLRQRLVNAGIDITARCSAEEKCFPPAKITKDQCKALGLTREQFINLGSTGEECTEINFCKLDLSKTIAYEENNMTITRTLWDRLAELKIDINCPSQRNRVFGSSIISYAATADINATADMNATAADGTAADGTAAGDTVDDGIAADGTVNDGIVDDGIVDGDTAAGDSNNTDNIRLTGEIDNGTDLNLTEEQCNALNLSERDRGDLNISNGNWDCTEQNFCELDLTRKVGKQYISLLDRLRGDLKLTVKCSILKEFKVPASAAFVPYRPSSKFIAHRDTEDWVVSGDPGGQRRSYFFRKTDGHGVCPKDYRVPTAAEWIQEVNSWYTENAEGGMLSALKLPAAGTAKDAIVTPSTKGTVSAYWTQDAAEGKKAWAMYNGTKKALFRSKALPIRCIKRLRCDKPINHHGIDYECIVSPLTGRVWLDKNIGASRKATGPFDMQAYGNYFQWGREEDGHQMVNSSVTRSKSDSLHNLSYDAGEFSGVWQRQVNYDRDHMDRISKRLIWGADWATVDIDGHQRAAFWSKSDGSSICPIGFRVPTAKEFSDELRIDTISHEFWQRGGGYSSFLKLPWTGYRRKNGEYVYSWDESNEYGCILAKVREYEPRDKEWWDAAMTYHKTPYYEPRSPTICGTDIGMYWTSEPSGGFTENKSKALQIAHNASGVEIVDIDRGFALSVRCIMDDLSEEE
ncbi:MAG: fibrobacter succinogenes major paralogous domain-containing protein [Sulfurovum sp.]|nr:fibrobacter succinogenes major paralogous domain-containing protein [Sulfurovum sp.]